MKTPPNPLSGRWPRARQRGSLLLSAMLVATAVGVGLVGYLNLSRNALKLSQRTYYVNCAANLAEAGLEEAVYCYRLMDTGTSIATAWSGWTLSLSNASLTLPSFSCGPSAVGVVKVYVTGFDGTLSLPSVVAQATITPLDGSPPITKAYKVAMKKRGAYNAAIITSNALTLGSGTTVDSFNSNPTGVAGATRLAYPGNGAGAKGNLVAMAGSITLGSSTMVNGNVLLGATVTAPDQSQVNGSIIPNYVGVYPSPIFPSWNGWSGHYFVWSIPAVLPRTGDNAAADGRYYYYSLDKLEATTITAGKNVTIVALSVGSGLTLGTDASCIVWCGDITTTGNTGFTNPNWAGALQFYSLDNSLTLGHAGDTNACFYAPVATLTLNGGGATRTFTGSIIAKNVNAAAQWKFHYDESLNNVSTQVGTGWSMTKWYDLQGTAELATLSALTGGFLF
ncbi:MAG: hypothetical protein NTV51_14660 [Verrucomicrobia bacterium]|nr:hypothetical protein [Verrucomicrobiota bacterium]